MSLNHYHQQNWSYNCVCSTHLTFIIGAYQDVMSWDHFYCIAWDALHSRNNDVCCLLHRATLYILISQTWFIRTFDSQDTHTYTYSHMHIYIHTYIHIFTHSHIHTCVHTYIRTYIRTYTHTYIHTYAYEQKPDGQKVERKLRYIQWHNLLTHIDLYPACVLPNSIKKSKSYYQN